MRIVDDQGQQQPNDGKAVGHLQVRQHPASIVHCTCCNAYS
jgi:hypothetical protein